MMKVYAARTLIANEHEACGWSYGASEHSVCCECPRVRLGAVGDASFSTAAESSAISMIKVPFQQGIQKDLNPVGARRDAWPLYRVVERRLGAFLTERRFQTSLLIVFSAVALLMAAKIEPVVALRET